jgi:ATP/ADP translocase
MATIALMASSKLVFRTGGWVAAALATPLSVLLSGSVFFAGAIAMAAPAGGREAGALAAALGPQVGWAGGRG